MPVITFRRSDKSRTIVGYTILLLLCTVSYVISHILVEAGEQVRLFSWDELALVVAGFILAGFQQEAGFPEMLQRSISDRKRLISPLLIGVFFGALDVIVAKFILHPEPFEKLPPFLQPFPFSVILYSSGAIYTEVFHRLIPLTIFMYLIHRFVNRRYHWGSFIFLAVLTSMYEPLSQAPLGPLWFVVYALLSGSAMNFIQAVNYRKYGFLAAVSIRIGHYLLWHILLGIYVEQFELP